MAFEERGTPEKIAILVVDDDDDIREVIYDALGTADYLVRCVQDGEAAIAELRAGFRPQVILLDLMMPGMDGRRFRTVQLAHAEWAPIPVIVMSAGNSPKGGPEECLRLRKPFDLDQLIEAISVARSAPSLSGDLPSVTNSGPKAGTG
jgi:CheY-like chemotaxis protein